MSIYHFHKDCVYFDKCNIKEEYGKIKFECPKWKYPVLYNKSDFNKVKFPCGEYIPIQPKLFE